MPQPSHTHSESYEERHDGIAALTICVHPGDQTRPRCTHCNELVVFTVMYRDGKNGITDVLLKRYGLPVEKTLLKSAKHWLCLGCYGKFQRQVVHIAEAGMRKGLSAA